MNECKKKEEDEDELIKQKCNWFRILKKKFVTIRIEIDVS